MTFGMLWSSAYEHVMRHKVVKKMDKEQKSKYLNLGFYTIIFSSIFFIVFGVVTVLIPNKFFARMASVTALDYIFLVLTSLFLGTYLSLHRYKKKHEGKVCGVAAASGGIGGFLGFGCAICNKLLVLLLGAVGVLTYIEPYRPFIGMAGISLMGFAVYKKSLGVLR